jgi:hypothetical protein
VPSPTTAKTDEQEFKKYTLRRDGRPPITLNGTLIGEGTDKTHDSSRWEVVRIYRSIRGRYVVQVIHLTCWQGEQDTRDAETFGLSAQAAIDWLGKGAGTLSPAAQGAVEDAAQCDDSFEAAWTLTVD